MRIAFIGGGNMATSLIGGLRARGVEPRRSSSPSRSPRSAALARQFGVGDRRQRGRRGRCGHVVLAVKPQESGRSRPASPRRSPMAGGSLYRSPPARASPTWRAGWAATAIVRAMPNRPALIGRGSARSARRRASPRDERRAPSRSWQRAADRLGRVESQMDVVTAVSGSGPAYFFLLIEALEDAAVAGPARTRTPARGRHRGGRGLMAARGPPAELRAQVTSKGGTTAAALEVFEAAGVRAIFARAVAAATQRSAELAAQFGGDRPRDQPGSAHAGIALRPQRPVHLVVVAFLLRVLLPLVVPGSATRSARQCSR